MTIWSSWHTSWSTKKARTLVLWSPDNCTISPNSGSCVTDPLHWKVFFSALVIFWISRSSASPWIVVIHFLPFLCCTRTCILELSLPTSMANGSMKKRQWEILCIKMWMWIGIIIYTWSLGEFMNIHVSLDCLLIKNLLFTFFFKYDKINYETCFL